MCHIDRPRAHDRGSGDPDAIRCNFGLAPVAKRFGQTILGQRRLASNALLRKTVCHRAKAAFGTASQPGKGSRAAKPRKQACLSSGSVADIYQDGRTISGTETSMAKAAQNEKCSRAEWRGCEFLGSIPAGRASVACRCFRRNLLRAEATGNDFVGYTKYNTII